MKTSAAILAVVAWAVSAQAQVSQFINNQGRLLDGINLVKGSVRMSLRPNSASGLGTLLYEDSITLLEAGRQRGHSGRDALPGHHRPGS